jgi:hypothetical protein
MIRSKWIESVRERLADMYVEYDSTIAKDTEMTTSQRFQIQKRLKELIGYIDVKLKGK